MQKQTQSASKMARGPRKHLKRLNAPSHWMLDKLSGAFAPRPSQGPHKLRECLPLVVILRNRLKYALNYSDAIKIVNQRLMKVDGKIRTDITFPAGFMDIVSLEKTGENFRLVYDTKGRFKLHKVSDKEAKYKLCKVRRVAVGPKKTPYLVTHDARTIRYPDPEIKENDTVKINIETGKIADYVRFETGNVVIITGGHNIGRVGIMMKRDRLQGAHDMIHVKDAIGRPFLTRIGNVFVIGKGEKPWISLPRRKGIRATIMEDRKERLEKNKKN